MPQKPVYLKARHAAAILEAAQYGRATEADLTEAISYLQASLRSAEQHLFDIHKRRPKQDN